MKTLKISLLHVRDIPVLVKPDIYSNNT